MMGGCIQVIRDPNRYKVKAYIFFMYMKSVELIMQEKQKRCTEEADEKREKFALLPRKILSSISSK